MLALDCVVHGLAFSGEGRSQMFRFVSIDVDIKSYLKSKSGVKMFRFVSNDVGIKSYLKSKSEVKKSKMKIN